MSREKTCQSHNSLRKYVSMIMPLNSVHTSTKAQTVPFRTLIDTCHLYTPYFFFQQHPCIMTKTSKNANVKEVKKKVSWIRPFIRIRNKG